jgi:hypothetical protein
MEIRTTISEGCGLEREEPLDVPLLDVLLGCIDVDGEVEESDTTV